MLQKDFFSDITLILIPTTSVKKIDVKQLNGSQEKEDHKKVTICINVKKNPKKAPLGRVTSVKTILSIWTTRIIAPK